MPVYDTTDQLYSNLQTLFNRIEKENPQAGDALLKSRLRIRLRCQEPAAEVMIDARQRPLAISYGPNNHKPDLDIALATDTLHQIMLGQLSLKKALGKKLIIPEGPVWKTMVLADLFRQAQALYPEIWHQQGMA